MGAEAAASVHFVDLAALRLVTSTLCPYSVHFVDLTGSDIVRSTLCTLPGSPSMPPLTFAGAPVS